MKWTIIIVSLEGKIPISLTLLPTRSGVRGLFCALLILGHTLKGFSGRIFFTKNVREHLSASRNPTKTDLCLTLCHLLLSLGLISVCISCVVCLKWLCCYDVVIATINANTRNPCEFCTSCYFIKLTQLYRTFFPSWLSISDGVAYHVHPLFFMQRDWE